MEDIFTHPQAVMGDGQGRGRDGDEAIHACT